MPIKSKKAMSCAVLAGLFVYVWWFSANALWLPIRAAKTTRAGKTR